MSQSFHIFLGVLAIGLVFSVGVEAQHLAVSGYVTDSESGETLIGATVYHCETQSGVVTDNYGFYQLAGLQPGTHRLVVSYVGFTPDTLWFSMGSKGLMLPEVKLKPRVLAVEEVSIVAAGIDRPADRKAETSMLELSSKTIQSIPSYNFV